MNLRISHSFIAFVTAFVMLLLLNSCGMTTTRPEGEITAEKLAERAYAEGEYSKAAEYWQQAGDIAPAARLDSLRVKTADAWLRSHRLNRAEELLSQVNQNALTRQELALFYIALADLALQQNNPDLAASHLQAVSQILTSSLKGRYNELQHRLVIMQGDPAGKSLREIAELADGITSHNPDLALEIVRSLESVPSGQLTTFIEQQQYDPEFTEWLELALLIRAVVVGNSSTTWAAQTWADYHYGHSIDETSFQELVARYRTFFPVPAKVAVLLPTDGSLSAASRAIRDGMLTAYLEQPGDAELRFYSSGENSESALTAYQQARDDGAIQVVGPLRLESTNAISNLEDLTTSVLLLNELSIHAAEQTERTGMLNSLLLSQTEEASAIATRALALGHKRVLMIVPDSDWGSRVEAAFSDTFEQGGGQITVISRFNTVGDDHGTMLTQLLKIDESKLRKSELQSWLGLPLNFEPHRRDDFDFIFMAVRPAEGRELKPLLRFHDAGDIPVYAMGRIFSGKLEPASDQDLNDIVFPTTRWQLLAARDAGKMTASVRGGVYGNFFALGQDAWRLLPWLPLMRKDPDLWYSGNIGALRLMPDGRIYREPVWAQISAGQPVPYQWPTRN